MLKTIQDFPSQFKESIVEAKSCDIKDLKRKHFKRIIVAAMGGSSLPTDLVNAYLYPELELITLRDYQVPSNIKQDDLILCSSFSGNTEETLTVFQSALEKKIPILCMSNGGQLKTKSQEHQIPFIQIPNCIQPRCASGYFFASQIILLQELGLLAPHEEILLNLAHFLSEQKLRQEELGRTLAQKLKDRLPIIYSDTRFEAACRIWKIKINENSKVQSWYNVFPELNHNEMVGYTQMNTQASLIYLEHEGMFERNKKRMQIMETIFKDKIPFHKIACQGTNLLEQIFDAVLIGDYTSYYLAQEYGIDPTPVALVEDFKQML